MLDLTELQRALQLPQLFKKIVSGNSGEILLLDNIELLFAASLKQDPLRLLKNISRKITVIAAWNGVFEEGYLSYAKPGHPEYRREKVHDFLVVSPKDNDIDDI